jgi:plastocyanin
MNRSITVVLGLAVIWLVAITVMASYAAFANHRMFDDMWDMMGDMGDMHGMMGGGNGPQTTASASGTGHVTISDFRFEPTVLTVTPGTVVGWTNDDSAAHTATARDESFDSGRLSSGDESAQVRFDTSGTFEYFCQYHRSMVGQIVVKEQ